MSAQATSYAVPLIVIAVGSLLMLSVRRARARGEDGGPNSVGVLRAAQGVMILGALALMATGVAALLK